MPDPDVPASQPPPGWTAAVSALVASAGAGIGGPEGVAAGAAATPGMLALTQRMLEEWGRIRLQRGAAVLEQASGLVGESPDSVVAKMMERPATQLLTGEAVVAGSNTALETKIAALARVVADAFVDDALVDVQRLVVAALADMETLHVRVLAHMVKNWKAGDELVMHELHAVASALPGFTPDVVHAVIGTFERHGLVFERPVDYAAIFAQFAELQGDDSTHREVGNWVNIPPPGWFLSDLGMSVHSYLAERGTMNARGPDTGVGREGARPKRPHQD